MQRSFFSTLVLSLLLPALALAQQSRVPMVAVMPFSGRSLDADALEGIASALGSDLLNTGKFRVMERSQMDAILKEQGFQQSGACDGSECAVEVGKLLAVDHMVVGTVAKVGGTYVVTTRLVSVGSGEVLRSVTKNSQAQVDAIVTDLLPQLAHELAQPTEAAASPAQPAAPVQPMAEAHSDSASASVAVPPVASTETASVSRSHWGWWVAGGAVVAGGAAAAVLLLSKSSGSSNSVASSPSTGTSAQTIQVVEP